MMSACNSVALSVDDVSQLEMIPAYPHFVGH